MTSATRIPCTVQLLCRNSAATITKCLDTLTAFDEVIVQDGYSTDGTREIAARYPNVRILDQDKRFLDADGRITHFANMRNESIRAARHDWLLVVDADEGIRPDLEKETHRIVEANVPGVYQAFRRFFIGNEPVMHAAGYPALQIRLFHRSLTEGYGKPIHERLVLKPGVQVRMLKSELPVPLPPARDLTAKYERYLRMEVMRQGVLPWGHWAKWILLRNLRSIAGLTIRLLSIWLLPRRGKRMPLAYEWQAIAHSWRTITHTFPPRVRRASARQKASVSA